MKHIALTLITSFIAGCTAPSLTTNGKTYADYGILNQHQNYDPGVRYEPNWSNIVVGVLFFELLFLPPIYVFGFHLMQPVGLKQEAQP